MKEQIKQIIDSYGMFHNPKKLEECAEEVAALETQALKEQMERVITDLTKILNQPTDRYIRLQDCYKYVEQLKTNLDKAELEGENGLVLEYGCRYLNSEFECEKGLLINSKCPNNCIYYDDGSR